MNPFSAPYKKLDNLSLVRIIDTPEDYQPEAVDAANEELADRQLTQSELTALQEEIADQKYKQQLKAGKINELKDKARNTLYTVTDTLNPIQSETPSAPKAILWISILMIMLFLYQLYTQFDWLKYMFTYGSSKWNFPVAMYFIKTLLLMPVAAVLFVLRKNSGWVLLSAYFTYLAINTIALVYLALRNPESSKLGYMLGAAPTNSLIGWAIFNAGCLYFIYKTDVQEIYSISNKNVLVSLGIGVLLFLLGIIS